MKSNTIFILATLLGLLIMLVIFLLAYYERDESK